MPPRVTLLAFATFATFVFSSPPFPTARVGAKAPHIFFLLADDLGFANVGFARGAPSREVQTPHLDALAASGAVLTRSYVHKFCSPTRTSIQTGRAPIRVNVLNSDIMQHNAADPVSGVQGAPRNMTGLATKLKTAGYATAMVGKWHAGAATPDHTPQGRGYDTSLVYFNMLNDYWTESFGQDDGRARNCSTAAHPGNFTATDLWEGGAPARGLNNSAACSQAAPLGCVYEDDLFTERVLATIAAADAARPQFIFWAPHSVHQPYEAPRAYVDKFAFVDVPARRLYAAQVNYLDDQVGRVVAALHAAGLWDNLLFVFCSDNGGPLYFSGNLFSPPALEDIEGGNNWPLRGGKGSNTEGGVRVPAFVAGGFLPAASRGAALGGFVASEDWYPTFCGLAGVDPADERAAAAGLPPVDGFDVWPMLSGANASTPRTLHFLGSAAGVVGPAAATIVQGVIRVSDGWKLLIGAAGPAFWTGATYPNASSARSTAPPPLVCGDPTAGTGPGCLFNILADPHETVDAAAANPRIVAELRALIAEAQKTAFSPDRGAADTERFCSRVVENGGFVGPFLP